MTSVGVLRKAVLFQTSSAMAGTITDTESPLMTMMNFLTYAVCSGYRRKILCCFYDMGYTDEEIEGMLCDRSMLRECIEEARVLVGEYY